MAFTQLITAINNGSYSAVTADGHSFYDTGILTALSAYTEIDLLFLPVYSGAGAPYACVYAVDINSNPTYLAMLTLSEGHMVLGVSGQAAIEDKLQVKVYPGISTPPVVFSLSITGKP